MLSNLITISAVLLSLHFASTTSVFNFGSLVPARFIESETDKIIFTLYPTKESLRYREELVVGDTVGLEKSSFNSSRPVILLIHGFTSDSTDTFEQEVKDAYLQVDTEANIIAVDWGQLSTPKSFVAEAFYPLALNNVPVVGRKVSEFLIFLIEQKVLKGPEHVHLVGHSLGAHVSGKAGRYFTQSTGLLLERITGLDPAGPSFDIKTKAGKLDSDDAKFVDIIHSNAGKLGYYGLLGHVDFYPNGGTIQPNCSIISALTTGSCEHSSAYKYFAKSIRDPNILACKCEKYFPDKSCLEPCLEPVVFGEHCPPTARGQYYLEITY